ncbi:hypothetical protein F2Q69_00062782 [Brassica cretica]|uniref:Uncharacterized protein n=1 Tax=Brassica cretica TaxID=69181 RepID=A0A8S9REC3_BRACR|nr:hypothetical protein F2Q69_00062782 [Brassica cretica]
MEYTVARVSPTRGSYSVDFDLRGFSSDNGEFGLNKALTVDSSPPIEEEEPKTQRFDPAALPPLRRERCRDRVCVGCWSCLPQQLACLASQLVCSRNHVMGSLLSWPLFLSLTMDGELATELTTRTMDLLRTTNLGILRISHGTHHQNHGLVKTESKNGALGVFLSHGVEEVL